MEQQEGAGDRGVRAEECRKRPKCKRTEIQSKKRGDSRGVRNEERLCVRERDRERERERERVGG